MSSTKFFGRLLPFFATFLVGIFVASFFVTLGRPAFGERRGRHCRGDQQMRVEMDRLREENMRLNQQLNDMRMNATWDRPELNDLDVAPPPPPPMLVKPTAPRAIR